MTNRESLGKLYLVGLGPGGLEHLTPAESKVIKLSKLNIFQNVGIIAFRRFDSTDVFGRSQFRLGDLNLTRALDTKSTKILGIHQKKKYLKRLKNSKKSESWS